MRIGLFTDTYTPDVNGVVSSIVTLQKELEAHGHTVFVITNHKAFLSTQREGNVLRLPGLELKWLYGYKLSTPYHFSAKEEIRKMNLDIIHVHTEFGVGLFARIVAHSLDLPMVSTYHTMYEDYTHYINKFEIEEVDKLTKRFASNYSRMLSDSCQGVIAPSDKTKEALLRYGIHAPIYVIPTGLSLKRFDPALYDEVRIRKLKERYAIKEEDRIVAYVGRVAKEKSIDLLIEAFAYVEDASMKLLIVGGGPQLEELKARAAQLQLEERVIFTDRIANEEIVDYYFMADVFVSASLTETQGMTFVEALACRLPVFARPDEPLEDLIDEGESGYYFHTPQDLAQALEKHFALPSEKREAMGEYARAKAKKYDSELFAAKVVSVYYQAIEDYENAYRITKVKAYDDYVKITVENDKDDVPVKLLISLDDYFDYKLRKDMRLDRFMVEEFKRKEAIWKAHRLCIKKLRSKDRTTKEILTALAYVEGLEERDKELIIADLEGKGYLNDEAYAKEMIEKLQANMTSKQKIIRVLMKKGIDRELTESLLGQYEGDDAVKAYERAKQLYAGMRGKSLELKKQEVIRKLVGEGFSLSDAKDALVRLNPQADEEEQSDALKQTIRKAVRMYQRKYQGNERKNRVVRYCMSKGFSLEEIKGGIAGMEWEDETIE